MHGFVFKAFAIADFLLRESIIKITQSSLVWSDFMLRMKQKIAELKSSLEKSMEKISSDYGNGLVNGFTQEFLGRIPLNLS